MTTFLRVVLPAIITLASGFSQAQTSTGLIAHWKLSGNGADSSGNGLHGTVYGAKADVGRNGRSNTAMRFDGTSFIHIPHATSLNTQKFSIAAIVKMDSFNMGKCNANTVFWRGDEFQPGSYSLYVYDNAFDNDCDNVDTNKNVFAGTLSTNPSSIQSGWQYSPNFHTARWYAAVMTFDGATARVYVDGVLRATNPVPFPIGTDTAGAFIGMRYLNYGYYPYPWYGLIDDIQLYNRVLSESEIREHVNYEIESDTPPELGLGKSERSPSFAVSPNPAKDLIRISMTNVAPGSEISILNNLGQLVHSEHIVSPQLEIASGSWPRGHYIIRVTSGSARLYQQLVLR